MSDIDELRTVADLEYNIDTNGKIYGPIKIGKSSHSKALEPSKDATDFIKNLYKSDARQKTDSNESVENIEEVNEDKTAGSDLILSAIPDEVVANLDEETINDI